MGTGDWNTEPLFLTIPPFAGSGEPRIEIGGNIPADLVTKYASIVAPETIAGGIFFYRGTNSAYSYIILTYTPGGFIRLCVGGRDTSGGIAEFWNWEVSTGAGSTFGRLETVNSALFGNQFATNLEILDGANFIVNDGAGAFIQDNADLTIQDGGDVFWQAGSRAIVQDTAQLTGEAGAEFLWEDMRHLEDSQLTASTTSSTTYANLTNICGTAFKAPPSGIVTLHYATRLSNNSAAGGAIMAPWVGTGTTVGSGTQFFATADANGILFFQHATASEDLRNGVSCIVTGLTPGDDYNVSMRARATSGGGTASFDDTTVIVVPSP